MQRMYCTNLQAVLPLTFCAELLRMWKCWDALVHVATYFACILIQNGIPYDGLTDGKNRIVFKS